MRGVDLRLASLFGFAFLCAALVLYVSQRVYQAQGHLSQIENQIEAEREAIRVLKAEWAYLNRPQHLEALAKQYLSLVPPDEVLPSVWPSPAIPPTEPRTPDREDM